MKTIILATTNNRKIGEAKLACRQFDIKVKPMAININEIQSTSFKEIAQDKARKAFELIHKPIVVTDTFWEIPALNGFPGGYMKDVADWFAPEDFINLIQNKKDQRIAFRETLAYQDNNQVKIFTQKYWGNISNKPRGVGNSIEKIACFNGYTLGERREQKKFSHETKDYIWFKFARWYSSEK
jgi:non-canonical purine NTP pyrophosphatase (RdgB/HAM1 family)